MTELYLPSQEFRERLGRLPSVDERDKDYPLVEALDPLHRALASPAGGILAPVGDIVLPKYKYWTTGPVLDQGNTSRCVAFSWTQNIVSSPIRSKQKFNIDDLYHEAQKVDEWPGENYDGTSVRAGAKVLTDWGYVSEYRWAQNVDETRIWVLTKGPVVFGTNWYAGMFTPDALGFLHLTGSVVGGHAFLCIGYDSVRKAFRFINSWGAGWGQNGRFWLAESDVQRLIAENGEVCTAIEKKV